MRSESEQIAADDVGRPGLDDRVLVRQPGGRLRKQRRELLRGPERRDVQASRLELLQHVDVPLEVELTDTVVRDRELLGAGIGDEVEVYPLDGDQHVAVGLHHAQRDVEPLCLLDGLVTSDDGAVAVDEYGAPGAVLLEGLRQGLPAPGRATVGVLWVWREIV